MSGEIHQIDLGAVRAKLVAAQTELDPATPAGRHVAEAAAMLTPRLDPDARHASVDNEAVGAALHAAHEALMERGVENPGLIVIVQSHDAAGHTTGRTLAATVANPHSLLRVCLRAAETNLERNRK